jgi:hypothetical protein
MRTRQWLVILVVNAGMIAYWCGMVAWAVFGHPRNPVLIAAAGGVMLVVHVLAIRRHTLPFLARARLLDNQYIPAPCHMGTFGRVVHVREYCQCRQGAP